MVILICKDVIYLIEDECNLWIGNDFTICMYFTSSARRALFPLDIKILISEKV